MVFSRILKFYNYKESKKLNAIDENLDTIVHKLNIKEFNITIEVAVGKENNIDNKLLYFPIYLIHKDTFISKIGVFEFDITFANTFNSILDKLKYKNGEINIKKMGEPLLFNFVTKELLNQYMLPSNNILKVIPEEKEEKNKVWVQEYMNDNNFDLLDIKTNYLGGNFDYFYNSLKIAFTDIRKIYSVNDLKLIVIECINENILNYYKKQHDILLNETINIKNEILQLKNKNKNYKKLIKDNTDNKNNLINIVNEAEKNIKKTKEYIHLHNYLITKYNEVSFMKNIHSLTDFKDVIYSHIFIPDKWVISVIEKKLNVKIILFLEDEYYSNSLDNVIDCSTENMIENYNSTIFNPEYYIYMSYSKKNNIYYLISYNHRCIFTFKSLDTNIKNKIIDKIKERNCGNYMYIDDIKKYIRNNNIVIVLEDNHPIQSELYNNLTTFQIYNNVNDNNEPGYGIGETINEFPEKYRNLFFHKSWRKNLYELCFEEKRENDEKTIYDKIFKNNNLKNILINTKDAKIVFFVPKSSPILAYSLMKIRHLLLKK